MCFFILHACLFSLGYTKYLIKPFLDEESGFHGSGGLTLNQHTNHDIVTGKFDDD